MSSEAALAVAAVIDWESMKQSRVGMRDLESALRVEGGVKDVPAECHG